MPPFWFTRMPKIEVIETKDGSSSLYLPDMDETYHSTHGALTESQFVFLKMGLHHFSAIRTPTDPIKILEIGFGTGLNAWLTAIEIEKQEENSVEFTTLEKFPLSKSVISQLNYIEGYSEAARNLFDRCHSCKWGSLEPLTRQFSLRKIETDITSGAIEKEHYDVIYFDAFAPSKQPEMWSPEVLNKMFESLKSGGVLVTYCAQGQFKRDLKAAGFTTEELPGPPGKKEMTRGTKP